jgi:hypothetical protein
VEKMKAGKIIPIVLAVCGLVFWPLPAHATPITIQIEAVVDSVWDHGNYLKGRISPGDIITGYYTYESTTPDSSPLDPVVGRYYHNSPPAGISLTVSGFDFRTNPSSVAFDVRIVNDNPSGQDIYALNSFNNLPPSNGVTAEIITWQLNDPTGTVFSSDALPTTAPVLDDWQINHLQLLSWGTPYIVDAHVTSAIPEPSTILLLGLGGIMLRKRG